MQNYYLLILLIIITLLKALADGHNYLYNTATDAKARKRHGIIYHLYGVALIGAGTLFLLFDNPGFSGMLTIIAAFALIYFAFFDVFYNLVTGREIMYIGKTDIIDMFLSRVFARPFFKWVLICIRWVCVGVALFLLIDVLKF